MIPRSIRPAWSLVGENIAIDWPDTTRDFLDPAQLFLTDVTDRQILHNLQLTAALAGIADPSADNLRQMLNVTRGGIKTPAGPRFVSRILADPDGWSLNWGITADDDSNGFHFSTDVWNQRASGLADLVANAAGGLRHLGLTWADPQAVLARLNSTTFRMF